MTQSLPTMNSLEDWHAGQMSDGLYEVRFVVADQNEARAWATWILSQVETLPPLPSLSMRGDGECKPC